MSERFQVLIFIAELVKGFWKYMFMSASGCFLDLVKGFSFTLGNFSRWGWENYKTEHSERSNLKIGGNVWLVCEMLDVGAKLRMQSALQTLPSLLPVKRFATCSCSASFITCRKDSYLSDETTFSHWNKRMSCFWWLPSALRSDSCASSITSLALKKSITYKLIVVHLKRTSMFFCITSACNISLMETLKTESQKTGDVYHYYYQHRDSYNGGIIL